MARRKKSSPLEDWMDLLALLPWWVGIALAFISYASLHAFATSAPPTFKPGDMGGLMIGTVTRGFAMAGQFFVPIICVFGALASFFRRKRRQILVTNVLQSTSADALESMSWREFELLVGEAFRLQGYNVVEVGGSGPDGGVDLVLNKGSEKFLVQCKQWKAFKVSVMVVRELYGVMAARGATGGFVVTSGRFTEDAVAFAKGRNIKLVDGPLLYGLIRQVKNSRATDGSASRNLSPEEPLYVQRPSPVPTSMRAQSAVPSCPSCGAVMTRRKAKRGANIGSEFWGCAAYPACKGTRSV